jgi:microcystin-dependent protein
MKAEINYKLKITNYVLTTNIITSRIPLRGGVRGGFMRLVNVLFFISSICYFTSSLQAQNVGINTSVPDASSILDITHTNRGLLIPRIVLTDVTVAAPITTPALSLLVFNTNTTVGANGVKPGYYYWNGTKWVGIGTGNAWELLGNIGTNAATNFIGTTDAQDLVFKTNSVENMRILNANGNVGIGTNAPGRHLHSQSTTNTNAVFDYSNASTSISNGYGVLIQNNDQTNNNYASLVFGGHSSSTGTIWAGIAARITDRTVGSEDANIAFWTKENGTSSEKAVILNNGNVGINNTAPANNLEITQGTAGNSGLRFTNLPNATALSTDVNGDVIPTTLNPANALYWGLTGNSGTTPATNFIGTTDAQDFVTRTNSIERMRVTSVGNVGIGTVIPNAKLHIEQPIIGVFALRVNLTNSSFFVQEDNDFQNYINIRKLTGKGFVFSAIPDSKDLVIKDTLGGAVGIGTINPAAKLDVASTTAGFAMPRMTSVQRKAIVAPIAGLQVYDTNLKGYYYYDGAIWDCVSIAAGTVNYFANATAPHGYLACAGQAVNRTTYAELFTAIGTLYGVGDGATTFNLPDLRGEFVRGVDNAGGTAKGVDAGRVIGTGQTDAGRNVTGTVNSCEDQVAGTIVSGAFTSYTGGYTMTWTPNGGQGSIRQATLDASASWGATHTSNEFRPRNLAMLPCIKF